MSSWKTEHLIVSSLPTGFKYVQDLDEEVQGGRSIVSLVEDDKGKKWVAKTVMKDKLFLSEVNIVSDPTMSHPFIVGGFLSVHKSTHAQFIFEYCPFGAVFERSNHFKFNEKIIILRQFAAAMLYCHEKGIVHADLKLENILLNSISPVEIKLCDFGLAFYANEGHSRKAGTLSSMAPEMIREVLIIDDDKFKPSYPCDYWGYGATAFELLLNKGAFDSPYAENWKIEDRILKRKIQWPHGYLNRANCKCKKPSCYSLIIDFIDKLLAFRPDKRMNFKQALEHPLLTPWRNQHHTIIRDHIIGGATRPLNPLE